MQAKHRFLIVIYRGPPISCLCLFLHCKTMISPGPVISPRGLKSTSLPYPFLHEVPSNWNIMPQIPSCFQSQHRWYLSLEISDHPPWPDEIRHPSESPIFPQLSESRNIGFCFHCAYPYTTFSCFFYLFENDFLIHSFMPF